MDTYCTMRRRNVQKGWKRRWERERTKNPSIYVLASGGGGHRGGRGRTDKQTMF